MAQTFDVRSAPKCTKSALDISLDVQSSIEKNRFVTPTGVAEEKLDQLWEQKNRLDAIFVVGEEKAKEIYYAKRDEYYPIAKSKRRQRGNRAGEKLCEICNATGFLDAKDNATFLDICGGPGAWSQYLLKEKAYTKGYGVSLRGGTNSRCPWYKTLLDMDKFDAVWGPNDDGDVTQDLEALSVEIKEQVDVVMCDGGDGFGEDDHLENFEELLAARLICAEARLGLKKLKLGGELCIKLFDLFTDFTASFIWGMCQAFEKVQVVKPLTSRMCNSERYLVARGLKHDDFLTGFIQRLDDAMMRCDQKNSVTTLFSLTVLHKDTQFVSDMCSITDKLCEQQTEALKTVLDAVDLARGIKRQNYVEATPQPKRRVDVT